MTDDEIDVIEGIVRAVMVPRQRDQVLDVISALRAERARAATAAFTARHNADEAFREHERAEWAEAENARLKRVLDRWPFVFAMVADEVSAWAAELVVDLSDPTKSLIADVHAQTRAALAAAPEGK